MANKENRQDKDKYDIELPQSIIESFARFLVPEIRRFYESEEGQREFKEWQEEHKEEKKGQQQKCFTSWVDSP